MLGNQVSISIRLGALATRLRNQIHPDAISDKDLRPFQADADAVTRLSVRGLLTEAQVYAARKKLVKRLQEAIIKC